MYNIFLTEKQYELNQIHLQMDQFAMVKENLNQFYTIKNQMNDMLKEKIFINHCPIHWMNYLYANLLSYQKKSLYYNVICLTSGKYTCLIMDFNPFLCLRLYTANTTTPDSPDSPGSPGSPDSPGSPGSPDSPGSPGSPDSPGSPGSPDSPGSPSSPDSPGSPGSSNFITMYYEDIESIQLQPVKNHHLDTIQSNISILTISRVSSSNTIQMLSKTKDLKKLFNQLVFYHIKQQQIKKKKKKKKKNKSRCWRSKSCYDIFYQLEKEKQYELYEQHKHPIYLVPNTSSLLISTYILKDLIRAIPANEYKYGTWQLIYRLSDHGANLNTLLTSCNNPNQPNTYEACLMIIKDMSGSIFGSFNKPAWNNQYYQTYYGSNQCYVFKVNHNGYPTSYNILYDDVYKNNPKLNGINIYYANDEEKQALHMINTDQYLAIGSSKPGCAIYLDQNLLHGLSYPCATYKNPCLSKTNEFMVENIEIFAFTTSGII